VQAAFVTDARRTELRAELDAFEDAHGLDETS
jgi:hypothetical protein